MDVSASGRRRPKPPRVRRTAAIPCSDLARPGSRAAHGSATGPPSAKPSQIHAGTKNEGTLAVMPFPRRRCYSSCTRRSQHRGNRQLQPAVACCGRCDSGDSDSCRRMRRQGRRCARISNRHSCHLQERGVRRPRRSRKEGPLSGARIRADCRQDQPPRGQSFIGRRAIASARGVAAGGDRLPGGRRRRGLGRRRGVQLSPGGGGRKPQVGATGAEQFPRSSVRPCGQRLAWQGPGSSVRRRLGLRRSQ
jgi:hypothetical protein